MIGCRLDNGPGYRRQDWAERGNRYKKSDRPLREPSNYVKHALYDTCGHLTEENKGQIGLSPTRLKSNCAFRIVQWALLVESTEFRAVRTVQQTFLAATAFVSDVNQLCLSVGRRHYSQRGPSRYSQVHVANSREKPSSDGSCKQNSICRPCVSLTPSSRAGESALTNRPNSSVHLAACLVFILFETRRNLGKS